MIHYRDSLEGITADKLRGFFVGWLNPPSPETHLQILRRSDAIVLAIDDDEERVVGFITAISDGILSAYIPLLEVLPEYRGRGIGTELVRRMLRKLEGLYMVDLCTKEDLAPFYERLGFRAMVGMAIRRPEYQEGIKQR
jgi:ribosomal protein S18 acetylase RimI-like enzyme